MLTPQPPETFDANFFGLFCAHVYRLEATFRNICLTTQPQNRVVECNNFYLLYNNNNNIDHFLFHPASAVLSNPENIILEYFNIPLMLFISYQWPQLNLSDLSDLDH